MSILVPGEIPKIIKKRSILVAEENPKIDLKSKKNTARKGAKTQRSRVILFFTFQYFSSYFIDVVVVIW